MHKTATIAIPARNEENNILRTIDSVLNQKSEYDLEVIVCANGCSPEDRTKELVYEKREKDKRVKLITSKPGKPNAWNKLLDIANYDNIIFMDGDVLAGKNSVDNLLNFMHQKNLVGAAPLSRKIVTSKNPVVKLMNMPYLEASTSLIGRMYSIRRTQFIKEMHKKQYHSMPEKIINEDAWATLILEEREDNRIVSKKWACTNNAIVYFQAPNIKDKYKQLERVYLGLIQLEKKHPSLGYEFRKGNSKIKTIISKIKTIENNKSKMIASYLINRLTPHEIVMRVVAEEQAIKEYNNNNYSNVWSIPQSTKKYLSDSQIAKSLKNINI